MELSTSRSLPLLTDVLIIRAVKSKVRAIA